jgi:hypothetical protein
LAGESRFLIASLLGMTSVEGCGKGERVKKRLSLVLAASFASQSSSD